MATTKFECCRTCCWKCQFSWQIIQYQKKAYSYIQKSIEHLKYNILKPGRFMVPSRKKSWTIQKPHHACDRTNSCAGGKPEIRPQRQSMGFLRCENGRSCLSSMGTMISYDDVAYLWLGFACLVVGLSWKNHQNGGLQWWFTTVESKKSP